MRSSSLGANRGFGRHVTDGLDQLLAATHENGPVSLIGWSLGGVHAIAPALTTVRVPVDQMSEEAASLFLDHLTKPALAPTTRMLMPTLVVRESTARRT